MVERDPDEEFNIELTADEAEMLAQGPYTWDGPGYPTDNLARAMGFRNVADLHSIGFEIGDRIRAREILTRRDWTRAIMALEISFGSDAGAGWEWQTVTGFEDEYSIKVVRGLQAKLVGVRLQGAKKEPSV